MNLKTPSRAASMLTIGMVLFVATTMFAKNFSAEKSDDSNTAKLVTALVERHHISRGKIDDSISSKTLSRFVKNLDPQKQYFTQADIDLLLKSKTELDDLLKEGNVEFAYKTFDLYLKRLNQRLDLADKFIDADHDFTLDESLDVDTESRKWAKSKREIEDRWRKRIKYNLLLLKLDDTPLDEARKRLHKRYHNVRQTIAQTSDGEKLEMYLSAFTHSFDPHSSYMSPETLEDFQIAMRLRLQGIGAALRSEDGFTTVAQIVPGGAADIDGRLKVGDKIIGVAQGDGELVDIVEMKLTRVVRLIRGDKGTKVRLQVKLADSSGVKDYVLTRQIIELKSAEVKGEIIKTGERIKGRQARIGVINIPSFYRDFSGAQAGNDNFKSTSRDVLRALKKFRDQGGVDGVIIDLRTNGGGALSESIEVSGLFIDQGPVVQVKQQDGKVKSHDDMDPDAAYTGPLVVICNRLSASASEIFAGVIKDYRRGIIVGDKTTHGKGTVQNVMPVSQQLFRFLPAEQRGALKLTINQFYRVNGDSTQNRGVESDVVLPSLLDHMDLGESFLENALKFDQIRPAEHADYRLVTPAIISRLQQGSQTRLAASEDFQRDQKAINKYLERKTRKTISLNEAVLRKEREEDKKDQEESKDDDKEPAPGEGPIFPENHYNDEVLQITVDYLDLLKGLKTAKK